MGFLDKYPYTNWHNVNLDWVLERVKEWGEIVEANDQAFKDLQEANESFKRYVTEYLENLDVQAQIDDKLDRMFESGELTDYLQPYVSDTVTDWLDEHITEPVGVVIDSSLTVEGAAADSKAVGNRFNRDGLNNDIRYALTNLVSHIGAWTDEHGREYVEALKVALNYDFYNIAYRSVSNGLLTLRQGGAGITTAITGYPPAVIPWNTNYPRYSVYVTRGIEEVYAEGSTDHVQDIYPIPAPTDKRNVTITITPYGQYFGCIEFSHNGIEYQRTKDNGWKPSGTTIALQESTAFIMVQTKYDNAGQTYPTQPTNIEIEFTA